MRKIRKLGDVVACTKCGAAKPWTADYFRRNTRNAVGISMPCQDCAREERRAYDAAHREERRAWHAAARNNTLVGLAQTMLDSAKKRARRENVPCTITYDEIITMLKPGICSLSGIAWRRHQGNKGPGPYSPTLDRIVGDLGYVVGNVRLILCSLNTIKRDGTDADLRARVRRISDTGRRGNGNPAADETRTICQLWAATL